MKTSRPAVRVAIVAALSLFFCLCSLPDLVRVAGHPNGDIGLETDGKIVLSVAPGLPAERAGIRPGMRIDLLGLTPFRRGEVVGGYTPAPGDVFTFGVWRANKFVPVTLRSAPETTAPWYIIIRELAFLVPLLIGIFLVLLRPSAITWGFFLFSLAAGGFPPSSVFFARVVTDWNWNVAVGDLQSLLGAILPKAGLVLFAFSLAGRPLGLWARVAIATTVALGVIETVPAILYPDLAGSGWPTLNVAGDLIAAAIALGGLFYAYSHVAIRLRQRLHWIAAGFIFWIVIDVTDKLLWPAYEPYWVHTAVDAAQVIFPLTVAYAILRERVVDINFVVSRTVAYGLMTTLIVAIFALIDLFLSRTMESRFSLPVDIVVALVLGFFFHGMRKRVDAGVDRVIFRKRHVAEMRLEKVAKAVVHVEEPAAIANYLTRLPMEVLDLTGAALYLRRNGGFSLELCTGWKEQPAASMSTSDSLVAFISAELGCVRVNDVPAVAAPADRHDAAVLAIPLVFRRELAGFVLYGAHEDGADLDADEQRALVPLVNAAAMTYDHLEAQALREENRALRTLQVAVS
jgi:hypothetical protein